MLEALGNLIITAVAVLAATRVIPGLRVKNFKAAFLVALGLALANAVLWTVFIWLTLPFVVLTFGLGRLVLNAVALWLVDEFMEDFEAEDVPALLWGSLFISAVSSLLGWVLGAMF